MIITPSYLRTRTTGQKNQLLEDEDFLNACLASDTDPLEALGLQPNLSRTDRCLRPVVLDRTNTATGETCPVMKPCNLSNAIKCPSCADFQSRLRQRQILNGLTHKADKQEVDKDVRTWVALLTTTAPTMGKVHFASWTAKNEYQASKVHPAKRDAFRKTMMKKKGKCPCGQYHVWTDPCIGTPLDPATYDYAKEVIWSENLPALTKSLNRKIRSIAESLGIPRKDLATFAVYERQRRASLHQHTLITVHGSKVLFDLLVEDIRQNWSQHSATAQIPDNKVRFYRSTLAQKRWEQFGKLIPQKTFDPDKSVPTVHWKRGGLKSGTQFGSVFDIRPLMPVRNDEDENISGYEQAGAYLAKYLTKNQSALSLDAIAQENPRLGKHYTGIRQATLALCVDRVIAEGQLSPHLARQKELGKVLAGVGEGSSFVATAGELARVADIQAELAEVDRAVVYFRARVDNIQASPLVEELFPKGYAVAVSTQSLTSHSQVDVALAGRGLAIRLNKVLDNGGFTGSLTSISNWCTTMTDLKEEMQEFARNGSVPDTNDYVWELNIAEMRKHAVDRAKPQGFSIRQNIDADLAEWKLKRLSKARERAELDDRMQKAFYSRDAEGKAKPTKVRMDPVQPVIPFEPDAHS